MAPTHPHMTYMYTPITNLLKLFAILNNFRLHMRAQFKVIDGIRKSNNHFQNISHFFWIFSQPIAYVQTNINIFVISQLSS